MVLGKGNAVLKDLFQLVDKFNGFINSIKKVMYSLKPIFFNLQRHFTVINILMIFYFVMQRVSHSSWKACKASEVYFLGKSVPFLLTRFKLFRSRDITPLGERFIFRQCVFFKLANGGKRRMLSFESANQWVL